MKRHAVEVLFRRKLWLVLPLLLIVPPSIAYALRQVPKQWLVTASVWVDQDKSLYTDDRLGYAPAVNQADLLNNFIRTRSFAESVLSKTPVASELSDPRTADRLLSDFPKHVHASASSTAFIGVTVVTLDRDLSLQIMQGTLDQFQQVLTTQVASQSQTEVSLASQNLADAEATLNRSQQALAQYLAAHPELVAKSTVGSSVSILDQDPQLAKLSQQVSIDQGAYSAAQQRVRDASQSAATGQHGVRYTFMVVDQPKAPLSPVKISLVSRMKVPAIGLVLGLLCAVGMGVCFVLVNHRVLGTYDLERVMTAPVLGELPALRGTRWRWMRRLNRVGRPGWSLQRRPKDVVRMRLTLPARVEPAERGTL